MPDDDDVPDSTDWLSTPLLALSAVESAMRCQVCKDFYETPMITSCFHTFCSLCIRRALSNDNKCPLCRTTEQEVRLRSNWSMEEVVESFKKARPAVLELARRKPPADYSASAVAVAVGSPKRKAVEIEEAGSQSAPEGKRLRSSARLSQRTPQSKPLYTTKDYDEDVIEVLETEDDDFVPPEPDDGLVACPSCLRRMKEWQVFPHLPHCHGPTSNNKNPQKPSQQSQMSLATLRFHPQDTPKKMDRLPALNYSLITTNALRKKLADIGISSYGSIQACQRRHREWVTLWNANCDAARPKKRSELVAELENWERTGARAIPNAAAIKEKDFDGGAWARKNNDSFKDLIASARRSCAAVKEKVERDAVVVLDGGSAAGEEEGQKPELEGQKPELEGQKPELKGEQTSKMTETETARLARVMMEVDDGPARFNGSPGHKAMIYKFAKEVIYLIDHIPNHMTVTSCTPPAVIKDFGSWKFDIEHSIHTCTYIRDEILRSQAAAEDNDDDDVSPTPAIEAMAVQPPQDQPSLPSGTPSIYDPTSTTT